MKLLKKEELPEYRRIAESGKKRSRSPLNIHDFLNDRINIIAEVKKSSPSAGVISRIDAVSDIASAYAAGGASAVSVLTERNFFNGYMDDLSAVSEKSKIPVLCKDFVYFDEQIDAAYISGADLILLIAGTLDDGELKGLYTRAVETGLTPLVEIHKSEEIERVAGLNLPIVLVNMRNLENLSIDFKTGIETLSNLPQEITAVSASGIEAKDQIENIYHRTGKSTFLIGTALMKDASPEKTIREMKDVY